MRNHSPDQAAAAAEPSGTPRGRPGEWFARAALGAVFLMNIAAAMAFLARPEEFTGSFELSGLPGQVAVRGFGLLFLMWNATYPLVILRPIRHPTLFLIILIQQALGVLGEAWIWLRLPLGHAALRETGLRFLLFDGAGLLIMGAAYASLFSQRGGSAGGR